MNCTEVQTTRQHIFSISIFWVTPIHTETIFIYIGIHKTLSKLSIKRYLSIKLYILDSLVVSVYVRVCEVPIYLHIHTCLASSTQLLRQIGKKQKPITKQSPGLMNASDWSERRPHQRFWSSIELRLWSLEYQLTKMADKINQPYHVIPTGKLIKYPNSYLNNILNLYSIDSHGIIKR